MILYGKLSADAIAPHLVRLFCPAGWQPCRQAAKVYFFVKKRAARVNAQAVGL